MIDVIIPTYNRVDALKKVIDSYMSQPELGMLIIVDDCSTDTTQQWADELTHTYPGKVLYRRLSQKTTLPGLRNIGVSLSSAEYIFMGEDDVLLPENHLTILLEKMQELNADIIAGRRIYLREGETVEHAIQVANTDTGPLIVQIPLEGYFERVVVVAQEVPFIHSNSLMKKKIFETIQYDPWYGGNAFREESDFYLRVTDAGFAIWIIPDTLSFHLKGTSVNTAGGSRKQRFIYEYQVWKNTLHCFHKNRRIFKKLFGVMHPTLFALRCLLARYSYAFKRRLQWSRQK